eukprot:362754-Chlamydomonas_euryale.AAC.18
MISEYYDHDTSSGIYHQAYVPDLTRWRQIEVVDPIGVRDLHTEFYGRPSKALPGCPYRPRPSPPTSAHEQLRLLAAHQVHNQNPCNTTFGCVSPALLTLLRVGGIRAAVGSTADASEAADQSS